jgi:hypothetical protein
MKNFIKAFYLTVIAILSLHKICIYVFYGVCDNHYIYTLGFLYGLPDVIGLLLGKKTRLTSSNPGLGDCVIND